MNAFKKLSLAFVFSLALANTFAQGTNCASADPFCSGTTYNFPNVTGVSAVTGPNYGCVSNAKNPAWYYMKIADTGPMKLQIKQTTQPNGGGSGLDVDFAIWGPFTDPSTGCTGVMNGSIPPIQSSYSTAATETIGLGMPGGSNSICAPGMTAYGATTPPIAQQGEYYMVMVTNYSGTAGYISLNQTNQTSSSGVTDCSIVNCDLSNLTATPTCNGNNVSITGKVTVATDITTGVLLVYSTCGTDTTKFYPPFPATATDLNFTLNGATADGQACQVIATFSGSTNCKQTLNITKPLIPATPTISTGLASCTSDAVSTITNYNASFTYTFTPTGPTVGSGGVISGATAETTYSVIATNSGCSSPASQFVNAKMLPPTPAPQPDPQSFCDTVTVADLVIGGYGIKFYATATSTTPMNPTDIIVAGTYYVTQTIGDCESAKTPFTVTINPSANINAGVDKNSCSGYPNTLKATGGNSYTWSPATGLNTTSGATVIASPTTTTTYIVTGKDANGCFGSDTVKIIVVASPDASFTFSPDGATPPAQVSFSNTSTNATTYYWNFGNGQSSTSFSPSTTFDVPGQFSVYLIADNGLCKDTAKAIVTVVRYPDPTILIPNVFTPNGDGANDLFFITTTNIKEMSFEIFNRWGNSMAKLNAPTDTWDGGKAAPGVYFYKYTMKDMNDESHKGHGFFHLVEK
jgi:gliding motility-associated-like protein